ncbi:hypothetical protein HAPAU_21560 [Halalkalicoccus paucihalophilus]|jgi:hypothetical protein|uniref:Uncharacterized protein n=1 Tax=Halalkalicoccus paucihalophilus TaxID=1008153 RepID=A0A151AD06_9EURY|nr:hypothetical protein [Halalkalicoccus paucihalophilus]KYH25484.1 hypothetical protein HAPAU_21560 [Halalkalicoccus paucihalophilus]
MGFSKLLGAIGVLGIVVLTVAAYVGYRLYSAFDRHGEFEFGWAVSDPEPDS